MTHITILTQTACPSCDHAKTVLTAISQDHAIEIEEVPLASDTGRALAAEHTILFAPGILIDGARFSHGRLSEKKLRRHLSQPDSAQPKER